MKDKRYSINPEFCGCPGLRFVLRFCGEFLGSFETKGEALRVAEGHNLRRFTPQQDIIDDLANEAITDEDRIRNFELNEEA